MQTRYEYQSEEVVESYPLLHTSISSGSGGILVAIAVGIGAAQVGFVHKAEQWVED